MTPATKTAAMITHFCRLRRLSDGEDYAQDHPHQPGQDTDLTRSIP
jgi:hypothetical protein